MVYRNPKSRRYRNVDNTSIDNIDDGSDSSDDNDDNNQDNVIQTRRSTRISKRRTKRPTKKPTGFDKMIYSNFWFIMIVCVLSIVGLWKFTPA